MYDVNPLGLAMYLKELERQSAARPARSESQPAPITVTSSAWLAAALRGFHTIGISRRPKVCPRAETASMNKL
jgi:hypothetical protein